MCGLRARCTVKNYAEVPTIRRQFFKPVEVKNPDSHTGIQDSKFVIYLYKISKKLFDSDMGAYKEGWKRRDYSYQFLQHTSLQ
jgi:hypothetical protein